MFNNLRMNILKQAGCLQFFKKAILSSTMNKKPLFHSNKDLISLDEINYFLIDQTKENSNYKNLLLNLKKSNPIFLLAKEGTYTHFLWEDNDKCIKMFCNLFQLIYSYSNFSENDLLQFSASYFKNIKDKKERKNHLVLDELSQKFDIIRTLSEAYSIIQK